MKILFASCPKVLWVSFLAAWVAGCASYAPAPVVERAASPLATDSAGAKGAQALIPGKDGYVVKKGDTLYSIALNHGLDYKDLVAWNGLENRNLIVPGQVLRITSPTEVAGQAPVAVSRPVGASGAVERRDLDGNTETLKREPKAGKEPYTDEAWARAQQLVAMPIARAEPKPEIRAEPKTEGKVEPKVEARPERASADAADDPLWSWPANGKMLAGFNDASNKGVDISGKAGDAVLAAGDGKVVYSGTGLRGYGQLVIVKHNATYLSAYAHNSKILVKEGQSVARGQKIAEMGNSDADQVKLHFEVRRQGKPVDPLKYLPAR